MAQIDRQHTLTFILNRLLCKRLLEQFIELPLVRLRRASGGRSRSGSSSIQRFERRAPGKRTNELLFRRYAHGIDHKRTKCMYGGKIPIGLQRRSDVMEHKVPGTLVPWLLLHPHDLGVGVSAKKRGGEECSEIFSRLKS